ncbi:MAG: hypothetical protein ABSD38_01090 [Syntrophorhabdales bacterium]|jgi:hypothetical protein
MKRILLILSVFLLLPCIAGAAVPTLVQHVAVNGINEPYKYTSIKIPLPNLTLSNNAVIARFFCDAGVTVTVSDDKTNGWASVVNEADGSNGQQGIWMAQGITAGARYITFSFSGSGVQYFNCDISEFYNVATSGGADATGVNVVSSTAITTAANVSPSTSGDLIYLAAASDTVSWGGGSGSVAYTLGSQSNITWQFAPGSTNSADGCVVQYGQYTASAAFKPAMTASSFNWIVCAMAVKSASAGTAPTTIPRVVSVAHYNFSSVATLGLQNVTQGNLQIALQTSGTTISAITSTRGTWNSRESASAVSGGGGYALLQDCSQSAGNQTLTVTYGAYSGMGNDLMLLDVTGAAASPWDTGVALSNESQASGSVLGLCTDSACSGHTTITPSTSNGLIVAVASVSIGTLQTTAGGAVAINGYGLANESDTPLDQNNGFGIYNNPNTSAVSFIWNETTQVGSWCGVAGAYKAPASAKSTSRGFGYSAGGGGSYTQGGGYTAGGGY